MSFLPLWSTCPQCGETYTYWGGMVVDNTDPGFCRLSCARSYLLHLILTNKEAP